jgi:hypothetical protein
MKLWRLLQIEGSFILKCRVPPLCPSYIGERRTTFAKAYGIKVGCYGEHVGEHIGNLGKNSAKLFLNACLGLPIAYMRFLFTKEFDTIFGLA